MKYTEQPSVFQLNLPHRVVYEYKMDRGITTYAVPELLGGRVVALKMN